MTRTRRIAATLAITAAATLGVAGIANASDYDHHHGHGHDGHGHDGHGYGGHGRYQHDRGLVGEVLHLVGDLL